MLYAILCYDSEAVVGARTSEQDEAMMARRRPVEERLASAGRLGAAARLMPTTAATTVRGTSRAVVLDGPFAETKEQLLGLYIIECGGLEEALEIALDFGKESGAFEVRPLRSFRSGVPA